MQALTLHDVSKVFGRHFALHRVNLTFRAGTLTLVLGGNGAGKTTLMNLVATLDSPTSGTIQFGDWDFETFARRGRRNIGWVSHDSLLYPELTGHENLTFYASMYGVEDPEGTASRWLERIDLVEAADKRVRAYSRGMRQRLSIARALIHRPAILLLDEPLTGLDQASRATMLGILEDAKAKGQIIVMITHEFGLSDHLVDHVAILHHGKLVFFEPFKEGMDLASQFLASTT